MDMDLLRRGYQEAERRRTERIRSQPGLVALDEWRDALKAIAFLTRQYLETQRPAQWVHGCRVFHSAETGEVEIEVQTIRSCDQLSLPTRVNWVNVRVRCVNPGG